MLSNHYKVDTSDNESMAPEEILMEANGHKEGIEVSIRSRIFRGLYIVIILFGLIFLTRAMYLQGLNGETFALKADQGRLYRYPVSSRRGIIYDKNGIALVENVPTFDLIVASTELIGKDVNVYKAGDMISSLTDMNPDDIVSRLNQNKDNATVLIKSNISKDEAIAIETSNIKGLYVIPYARRLYTAGRTMSHILGYTSNITSDEMVRYSGYESTDRIGRVGIESYYEDEIKGDKRLYDLHEGILVDEYNPGSNIFTTIDLDMQEQLYDTMSSVFTAGGMQRGAGVIQNVDTGEVLAMVSIPTFDPNIFEQSTNPDNINAINYVLQDNNRPLFNRVVGGLYPPGSTIKPFWALVGLSEGVVTRNTIINSPGYIEVPNENDPSIVYRYNDWKVHGLSDIMKAIADSVDVYFYALGGGYEDIRGVGISVMSKYIKKMFADRLLGVDLPNESKGTVPNDEWKRENKGEPWYKGDTYNVSIGQGDLLVTPLWINGYISAIANGGRLMQPYIVNNIESYDGSLLFRHEPKLLEEMPFDFETLNIVRSGMLQATVTGTARSLADLPIKTAGKTGTVQIGRNSLNSLFTVYAPYDKPEIAITIVVEDIDKDQNLATRVAKEYLSWYFSRDLSTQL